jgi:hypothetical protein
MQSKSDKKSFPNPVRPVRTEDRNVACRAIRFNENFPVPDTMLSLL